MCETVTRILRLIRKGCDNGMVREEFRQPTVR